MSSSNVTVIAGPTAAGKSALAEKIAHEKNGAIINADALQIYNALPILTAQPDLETRTRLPHALYGVLPPTQNCNAGDWVSLAIHAIQDAWAKGQHPIVVGGTGLYLKALIIGLSPLPDVPAQVRSETRDLHARLGNPAFHEALSKIDSVMAARLKPNDSHRLMRAYEIKIASGKSLAEWQDLPPCTPLPHACFRRVLVDGPRDVLRARARARLDQMIENGVLREIAEFLDRKLPPNAPPTRALGYHALADHVRGKLSIDEALHAAHLETCQYIKRQQTWFRHQMVFDETVTIS